MPARTLPLVEQVPVCCPNGLTAPLDRAEADALARQLKAIADPVRLQLLALIRSATRSEACVCDLTDAVNLSQPTVSHHLKVLVDAELLTKEKRGYWTWYAVDTQRLAQLGRVFT